MARVRSALETHLFGPLYNCHPAAINILSMHPLGRRGSLGKRLTSSLVHLIIILRHCLLSMYIEHRYVYNLCLFRKAYKIPLSRPPYHLFLSHLLSKSLTIPANN